eukprot:9105453-Pyramimonas_sp.AAC.1
MSSNSPVPCSALSTAQLEAPHFRLRLVLVVPRRLHAVKPLLAALLRLAALAAFRRALAGLARVRVPAVLARVPLLATHAAWLAVGVAAFAARAVLAHVAPLPALVAVALERLLALAARRLARVLALAFALASAGALL